MQKTTTVITAMLFLSAAAFPAGDPAGFHVWKAGDIEAKGKQLSAKITPTSTVASELLDTVGNRSFQVAHREGDGQAEWHEKQADVIVIQSGGITLVTGGEIVGSTTSAPGEIRGTAIKGGTETIMGPGDVVHIPAKTPHQMKIARGKFVTYFVVKVTE